jgi:MFS family permease
VERRVTTTAGSVAGDPARAVSGAGIVLLTLATAQFLMILDSSVMNVSIATVAEDVGTTVTGIQTAITLYMLVMASMTITGGKIGTIIGRRRAFAIGCVIYGAGSMTTAFSQSLPMLLFGWSLLEGIGGALILPAIVALVASNVEPAGRTRAYGLIASAAAIAVAAGPLIGGFATTYFSWRYVFAGEVVLVVIILALQRRMTDAPPERAERLDIPGAILSASGLALFVFGILQSGEWGWIMPKTDAAIFGLSPTIWLVVGGIATLGLFAEWERRVERGGGEPLVKPGLLRVDQLRAGLTLFFFQYLAQSGLFFIVPLFLSVALGLTAIATGIELLPISITLLAFAIGIPRLLPRASPRRVSRFGLIAMVGGLLLLIGGLELGAGAEVVTLPLAVIGAGIGALASQLGAVTVSSLPDSRSPEVGGVQNTMTNLGASIGTALAGSVLIAALTASFLAGIAEDPRVPQQVVDQATVQLAPGIPFVSDVQLQEALDAAGVEPAIAEAIVDDNAAARIDGLRAALAVLALLTLVALLFSGDIPERPIGAARTTGPVESDEDPTTNHSTPEAQQPVT